MKYKSEVRLIKNGAKANGQDSNIIEISLMNGDEYVDYEQLHFKVTSPAFFQNHKNSIFLRTHVRGECQVEVYSQISTQFEVSIYLINSAVPIQTVVINFSSSTDISELPPPVVEVPVGNSINFLGYLSYYDLKYLNVKVNKYDGMKEGQTVKLYWEGRNAKSSSEIINVKTISSLYFKIPRYDFIDSMGHQLKIHYTVQEKVNKKLRYSESRLLGIERQSVDLPAPILNRSKTTLSISYPNMTVGDKLAVCLTVNGHTLFSDVMTVKTIKTFIFNIPQGWIHGNAGKYVLFNYSTSRNNKHLYFSYYLRVTI